MYAMTQHGSLEDGFAILRTLSIDPAEIRRDRFCRTISSRAQLEDGNRPILLKNPFALAMVSVVENVDPLERAQSDANRAGDGF